MRFRGYLIALLSIGLFGQTLRLSQADGGQIRSPRKLLVLFGGYDGTDIENQFHASFIEIATQFRNLGWEEKVFFGDDRPHPATTDASWSRAPIAQAMHVPESRVPTAKMSALIATLAEASNPRRGLQKGDSILLYTRLHGESGPHRWWVDGKNEMPAQVKPYLEVMEKRGVKVGLIDSSCYSGESLAVFGEVGCVLAGSPRDAVACGEVENSLILDSLKRGSSMEDFYLRTLRDERIFRSFGPGCFGFPEASGKSKALEGPSLGRLLEKFAQPSDSTQISTGQLQSFRAKFPRTRDEFRFDHLLQRLSELTAEQATLEKRIHGLFAAPIHVHYTIPRGNYFYNRSSELLEFLSPLVACDSATEDSGPRVLDGKSDAIFCHVSEEQQIEQEGLAVDRFDEDWEAEVRERSRKMGNTFDAYVRLNPQAYGESFETFYGINGSRNVAKAGYADAALEQNVKLSLYAAVSAFEGDAGTRLRQSVPPLTRRLAEVRAEIMRLLKKTVPTEELEALRVSEAAASADDYEADRRMLEGKVTKRSANVSELRQLRAMNRCRDFRF